MAKLPRWVGGTEVAGVTARSLSWVALSLEGESTAAEGETSFVASTGEVDRMGDSIDQGSWVLDHYARNGVVLADHDGRQVVGAGRAELVDTAKGKQLHLHVRWDDQGPNELGKLLAHQHANGFRKAVSVGFIPGKSISRKDLPKDHPLHIAGDTPRWMAGYLYEAPELLEVSSVGVPALRSALQLDAAVASHTRGTQYLPAEWVRDIAAFRGVSAPSTRDELLHALRTDPEIRLAIRAQLIGAPSDQTTTTAPRWVG